ncbi:hypothetical protein CPB83DRAFT_911772 [Crepidotus variabilis]|uniref:Uncharacterized protein n=1 Tax=Crepidotus variabilis TaxID=179855 RepID=A0A9P6BC46_9AGAR|nr:hypothetical protein CPB83DRAFT_911781 [Crepidotus variabilis]KAF9521388.1 hypothetical protein CPB83DRAFT_911772 [Crepidotus variabilis]
MSFAPRRLQEQLLSKEPDDWTWSADFLHRIYPSLFILFTEGAGSDETIIGYMEEGGLTIHSTVRTASDAESSQTAKAIYHGFKAPILIILSTHDERFDYTDNTKSVCVSGGRVLQAIQTAKQLCDMIKKGSMDLGDNGRVQQSTLLNPDKMAEAIYHHMPVPPVIVGVEVLKGLLAAPAFTKRQQKAFDKIWIRTVDYGCRSNEETQKLVEFFSL